MRPDESRTGPDLSLDLQCTKSVSYNPANRTYNDGPPPPPLQTR